MTNPTKSNLRESSDLRAQFEHIRSILFHTVINYEILLLNFKHNLCSHYLYNTL